MATSSLRNTVTEQILKYTYNPFHFYAALLQLTLSKFRICNSSACTQISDNTTKNTHDGTNIFTARIRNNVFTGVCLLPGEGRVAPFLWSQVLSRGGVPWPLVQGLFQRDGEGPPPWPLIPDSFRGCPPPVLSLVLSKVMFQVLPRGWVPLSWLGVPPPLRMGYPPPTGERGLSC